MPGKEDLCAAKLWALREEDPRFVGARLDARLIDSGSGTRPHGVPHQQLAAAERGGAHAPRASAWECLLSSLWRSGYALRPGGQSGPGRGGRVTGGSLGRLTSLRGVASSG